MTFARTDFARIQASLWAAVLMIATGMAALYLAYHSKSGAEVARQWAVQQRNEADGKLKQVREEELEIKQKSALFNRLLERGILGEEQRLEWVELLKEVRDKRQLIDLRYEIAPQRALDRQATGGFTFFASAMKLQVKLLHEEDLTRLLGDLRTHAKALIRVQSCTVARLPPTSDERSSGRANLTADCEIDWLTMRDLSKK